MRQLFAASLAFVALAGCAGAPARVPAGLLPADASADPDQYLLVTVRNVVATLPLHAGSTQRGYDGVAAYTVSSEAQALARAIAEDYGLQQVAAWPIAVLRVHCVVYRLPVDDTGATLRTRLATDSRVQLVQPLQSFHTAAAGYNDRYASLQRGFDEMSVAAAHRWSRGEGVVVAIIDSGVDTTHPDLAGRVRAVRNFVAPGVSRLDRSRHGTEIAGVIAAVDDNGEGIVGVAPRVELLALRACWQEQATDTAARCNSFTIARALAAAIDARADVINLSLVGPADPLLGELTARATALGSIVVGAVPASGRMDGFPAGAPGVLPVQMSEGTADGSVALRAPGKEILTLVPGGGYDFATGSSLAAGSVSGIVALLRARRSVTAAEAQALLAGSMRRAGAPHGSIGSIDACVALAALLESGDCPHPDGPADVPMLHATRDVAGRR